MPDLTRRLRQSASALSSRLRSLVVGTANEPSYRHDLERRKAIAAMYGVAHRLSSLREAGTATLEDPSRHPVLQLTQRTFATGARHDAQLLVFHAMREYVPTLDAAIKNRRTLEGDARVVSEDDGLAQDLNDWMEHVPVGYVEGAATLRGLDTYANLMAENADEYGFAAGEMLTDEQGTELRRLVVPNARTLSMRENGGDGFYGLYQTQRSRGQRRIDDHPLVQTLTFTASPETPWPYPMAWSLVKASEVVLRMYEAVTNGWWRFGDPSLFTGIEYSDADAAPQMLDVDTADGTSVRVPSALVMLKESLEHVMAARRHGDVGDVYGFTDGGGKFFSQVLGQIDATMMRYFREQSSYFDAQIISSSATPAWMYPHVEQAGDGLGSNRSEQQAAVVASDAHKRNRRKARLIREVLDTLLLLTGAPQFIGVYELDFDGVNVLDEKAIADTALTEAQAAAAVIDNAVQAYDEEGNRRFTGEAERILEVAGIYPASA